jgi:hypothetical protein
MSESQLTELARQLADRLKEDIEKCVTREDHIRVTARANEASHLLSGLETLFSNGGPEESAGVQTDQILFAPRFDT